MPAEKTAPTTARQLGPRDSCAKQILAGAPDIRRRRQAQRQLDIELTSARRTNPDRLADQDLVNALAATPAGTKQRVLHQLAQLLGLPAHDAQLIVGVRLAWVAPKDETRARRHALKELHRRCKLLPPGDKRRPRLCESLAAAGVSGYSLASLGLGDDDGD